MATRASLLKVVRLCHLYIGVFIAPAVVFFAVTGALQTFALHKTGERKGYTPPRALAVLARIHKDATPILAAEDAAALDAAKKKAPPAADPVAKADAGKPAASATESRHVRLPLQLFFLLVAINLVVSTGSGIYMAYKYKSNKLLVGLCLAAGVVIPVVFTIY